MKILAFTDIHSSKKYFSNLKSKAKEADILVCAGDITLFEQDIEYIIEELNNLGQKLLLIHGNHEDPTLVEVLCKSKKNIIFLHKKTFEFENITFLGFGGGGFSLREPEFESWSKSLNLKNKKIVFIHHAPPFGTNLDLLGGSHRGCDSYKEFILDFQPIISISGHFHETFGFEDTVNNTLMINPGPKGTLIKLNKR
jgi:Icc-related predicted phosphoesterase